MSKLQSSPYLPPEAPLAMPDQRLSTKFHDPSAPKNRSNHTPKRMVWRRVGAFGATLALTAAFTNEMAAILSANGMTWLERGMTALFALSFVWIAMALTNAIIGAALCFRRRCNTAPADAPAMTVALLMPTYNEAPDRVMSNAAAMLSALNQARTQHRYDLFVLSDTTDDALALQEEAAIRQARAALPADVHIYYRRRHKNTDRKSGNIREWCRRFGGAYDAMLLLDADSLMSAAAISSLTEGLATAPGVGLVQSIPRLINTPTLFGRLQRFATAAYGPVLAEGLSFWAGDDGNYWGHNAIIRTSAFAACAGLPHLKGPRPLGGAIMSHDFVEAALLRRAGWRVRILTTVRGSFEEAPPSLIDAIIRDRRWSQGNLQHLGVIGARGFHWVSRYHLLQGIMSYLSAPVWLLFLIVGAAVHAEDQTIGASASLTTNWFLYNPFLPTSDPDRASTLLIMTLTVLVLPKAFGLAGALRLDPGAWRWGGHGRLFGSMVIEIILSALIAPILMTQQTLAVLRTVIGVDYGWRPQARKAKRVSLWALLRFHWVETALGLAAAAGIATWDLSIWLSPIAVSLILAAPISALSTLSTDSIVRRTGLLATPEDARRPFIVSSAARLGLMFAALRAPV